MLLKERLRRQDWRLIVANSDSIDEKRYASGDFKSVDYRAIRKRLRRECGLELPRELRGHLRGLQARRNRVEHFQIHDSHEAVLSSAAHVAGDLLRFVGEHLEPEGLSDAEDDLVQLIREEVTASDVMLEVHLTPVLEELTARGIEALECPRCSQETLALEAPVGCRFCGFQGADGPTRADEFISSVLGIDHYRTAKDGGEWPQYNCPECETASLVRLEQDLGDRYVCFECATIWPPGSLTTCNRCEELIARSSSPLCDSCWSDISHRDD